MQLPGEWSSKMVNQTLERITIGSKDQSKRIQKSIKKARLDLTINQQFFYKTEAILLEALQTN